METRSKARVGHAPDLISDHASDTPENPSPGSSTDSSLNLTVMLDDRVARVVGASYPAVRATIKSPGTTLVEQDRDAADDSQVREPEYPRGSPSEDTVEPRRTPTRVIHQNKWVYT